MHKKYRYGCRYKKPDSVYAAISKMDQMELRTKIDGDAERRKSNGWTSSLFKTKSSFGWADHRDDRTKGNKKLRNLIAIKMHTERLWSERDDEGLVGMHVVIPVKVKGHAKNRHRTRHSKHQHHHFPAKERAVPQGEIHSKQRSPEQVFGADDTAVENWPMPVLGKGRQVQIVPRPGLPVTNCKILSVSADGKDYDVKICHDDSKICKSNTIIKKLRVRFEKSQKGLFYPTLYNPAL